MRVCCVSVGSTEPYLCLSQKNTPFKYSDVIDVGGHHQPHQGQPGSQAACCLWLNWGRSMETRSKTWVMLCFFIDALYVVLRKTINSTRCLLDEDHESASQLQWHHCCLSGGQRGRGTIAMKQAHLVHYCCPYFTVKVSPNWLGDLMMTS